MGNLTRENEKEEWGFILTGGGRDKDVRLFIEQVKPGSIAEKVGLKVKDSLVKIGNDCALDYTRDEAMESLKRGKDFFDMIVERNGGCPQVDRHGSREFVQWQHEQQELQKQISKGIQGYPEVDRHGSTGFVAMQHKKQSLHKLEMNGFAEVDQHGSHAFVQWQHEQQKLQKQISRGIQGYP